MRVATGLAMLLVGLWIDYLVLSGYVFSGLGSPVASSDNAKDKPGNNTVKDKNNG